MHYIKCAVNSSLLTILIAAGLWHLEYLFYHDTQYSQRGCFTNLLWCDIPQNNAPQTGPHHIRYIYTRAIFLAVTSTQTAAHLGWWFRWPVLVMATLESQNIFAPTLGLTANLGLGWSWLFPSSSIKFLTRSSLKSLSVYLAPHADNSIQLLSTVRSRRWKKISCSTFCWTDNRMNICVPSLRQSPGWQ